MQYNLDVCLDIYSFYYELLSEYKNSETSSQRQEVIAKELATIRHDYSNEFNIAEKYIYGN